MRKRSACGATTAAVHPWDWEKRHMKSLISYLIIGKRCRAKTDIPAGKSRASQCLLALCLSETVCICRRQPVLSCLEDPSRSSCLAIPHPGTKLHPLLRSWSSGEQLFPLRQDTIEHQGLPNTDPPQGLHRQEFALDDPGKSGICCLLGSSITSCTTGGFGERGRKEGNYISI